MSRRRITLAGPRRKAEKVRPIFAGEKRRHMVSRVLDVLRDWRLSPFENEGSTRAGIRAGLILAGHGWRRADNEAAGLVAEGLRLMGAVRPTWIQGQPEYVIPRENCQNCGGPLDEEDFAQRRRFCSDECSTAMRQFRNERYWYAQAATRHFSTYVGLQEAMPAKPCAWCETLFRPLTPEKYHETETCSVPCREALLISRIPRRDCDQCGKNYQPVKTHSHFCSDDCRTANKNAVRNAASQARRAPRPCTHCGEVFEPTKANQIYCGARCKANALYARHGWVAHESKPCVECGKAFTPKSRATQVYCSSKCQTRVWARRRRQAKKAASQASAFRCEEVTGFREAAE